MQNDNSEIALDMADRALKQGELYLQSQLATGIAGDQRATTFAALFTSLATAIVAASLAYWAKTENIPLLMAGLIATVAMVVGSGMCLWSARPVDFYFPGNHPASWEAILHRPIGEVIYGEALNYQDHIEANAAILERNATWMWRGAKLAIASPLIAVAFWGIAAAIFPSSPAETVSGGSQILSSSGETSHSLP